MVGRWCFLRQGRKNQGMVRLYDPHGARLNDTNQSVTENTAPHPASSAGDRQPGLGGVMRHEQFKKRHLSTMVLTTVVTGMLGAGALAWENPLKGRYLSGAPLSICDQGSFFVGG